MADFIVITDRGGLKRAAKALRTHADGKVLRKEMTGGIRNAVRPALNALRAAYGGGKHLRPALRRASKMTVRTGGKGAGVRVSVDGFRMPPGMGSLPAYREGYRAPWRHPVYGNQDVWVSQAPVPVFDATVPPFADDVHRELERIGEEITNKIAGG